MFGVSIPELLLVFVLVLIVFGPEKLPEIAATLGKTFATVRKSTDALRREFYNSMYTPAEDFRNAINEAKRELTTLTPEAEEKLLAPDPNCPDAKPPTESTVEGTEESQDDRAE